MTKIRREALRSAVLGLVVLASCVFAKAQLPTDEIVAELPSAPSSLIRPDSSINILPPVPSDEPRPSVGEHNDSHSHGFIIRNLRRGLEDQKSLYRAPFKRKNIKWDIGFLAVTAGLLAADRETMRDIPKDHLDLSHNSALVALLGTSAVPSLIWAYGLKTGDRHADETGEITLETLANTFLIYTPMQFIAGRERPDEAAGNGRFLRHGNFNTSFPAGHPMFTWAMATVVAHEYPKTWVKIMMYGAASAVSAARLTGRNHFPSDIWVGSVLGYLIGSHIFHMRCDPNLSEACHAER